jgi:hypothetical protein
MPTPQQATKPIKRVLYDILHSWFTSSIKPSLLALFALALAPESPSSKNFLNLSCARQGNGKF